MRRRDLEETDIPAFIELVPYGPNKEEWLRRNGYVYSWSVDGADRTSVR